METYLKDALGEIQYQRAVDQTDRLPFYLREAYSFFPVLIYEKNFLLIKPKATRYITSIQRDTELIESQLQTKCILLLDKITKVQRDNLIKNVIQFIVLKKQIFLPFLGIELKENYDKISAINKFSPAAQLLFLHLIYNQNSPNSQIEIAKALNIDKMTASRGFSELVSVEYLSEEHIGTKIIYKINYSQKETFNKFEKYLFNPIRKKINLEFLNKSNLLFNSGISALCAKTNLMQGESNLSHAVYYKHYSALDTKTANTESGATTLELWRYNPALLTKTTAVDDISLYLTLRDEKDERVQIALDNLIGRYKHD